MLGTALLRPILWEQAAVHRLFLCHTIQQHILNHEVGRRHLTHPLLVLALDHLDIPPGLGQVRILQLEFRLPRLGETLRIPRLTVSLPGALPQLHVPDPWLYFACGGVYPHCHRWFQQGDYHLVIRRRRPGGCQRPSPRPAVFGFAVLGSFISLASSGLRVGRLCRRALAPAVALPPRPA